MALKVWLPLNGDLENKGISDISISTNNFSINNLGKLGKCYQGHGLTHLSQEILNNNWSIALWVKETSAWSQYNQILFCKNLKDSSDCQIYFSIINGKSLNLGINGPSGTGSYNYNFNLNTWYHVAATYDGLNYCLYINGTLVKTGTCTTAFNANKLNLGFGCRSANDNATSGTGQTSTQCFNDFRLYDHCLSPLEVKEISQGLILHYKLDRLEQSSDNFVTGILAGGQTTVNNLIVTTSGENKDTYFRLQLKQPLIEGKTYKISCVGENIPNNSYWRFPIGAQSNTSLPFDIYEGYNEYTFVANSPCTSNPLMMDDVNRNYVYMNQCVFKNFQLYECDNIVDSSGYGHDGTILSTLSTASDAERYKVSTSFNGTDSGILIENLNISNIINNAITYSFWIKPNGENGARSVYFGSYSGTSWSIEKTTGNLLRLYWNGSPDEACTGATITDGIWQHVCITKNGSNDVKVYINGVQKWTSTAAHNTLTFPTTYRIGRDTRSGDNTPYKGLMSDFRIYATALSAEDIATLYHTPAQIDNLGCIHGFEFEEKQGNSFATELLGNYNSTSANWDSQNNQFTIVSPNGTGSRYGLVIKNTNSRRLIPWGYTYRFTFDIYVPITTNFNVDYNNYSNDSSVSLSGNDNDDISKRLSASFTVNANTWTTVTLGSSNTSESKNPNHVTLYDQTNFGIKTDSAIAPVTWYLKNPQWYLIDNNEATNYQVYQNGIFKNNFMKQNDTKDFASFRNNEKAVWATNFIEK